MEDEHGNPYSSSLHSEEGSDESHCYEVIATIRAGMGGM